MGNKVDTSESEFARIVLLLLNVGEEADGTKDTFITFDNSNDYLFVNYNGYLIYKNTAWVHGVTRSNIVEIVRFYINQYNFSSMICWENPNNPKEIGCMKF